MLNKIGGSLNRTTLSFLVAGGGLMKAASVLCGYAGYVVYALGSALLGAAAHEFSKALAALFAVSVSVILASFVPQLYVYAVLLAKLGCAVDAAAVLLLSWKLIRKYSSLADFIAHYVLVFVASVKIVNALLYACTFYSAAFIALYDQTTTLNCFLGSPVVLGCLVVALAPFKLKTEVKTVVKLRKP